MLRVNFKVVGRLKSGNFLAPRYKAATSAKQYLYYKDLRGKNEMLLRIL